LIGIKDKNMVIVIITAVIIAYIVWAIIIIGFVITLINILNSPEERFTNKFLFISIGFFASAGYFIFQIYPSMIIDAQEMFNKYYKKLK